MCGIFCSVFQKEYDERASASPQDCTCHIMTLDVQRLLCNRGPDFRREVKTRLATDWCGHFLVSVLWMQGRQPAEQPMVDEYENMLLWNGDVFNNEGEKESDTTILAKKLSKASLSDNCDDSILSTLSKIEGPWSFIFWHARLKQLWFGRDAMGRHSLLWAIPDGSDGLIVTSVATRKAIPNCRELPACGVFVADLSNSSLSIKLYPWNTTCMENSIYSPLDYPPHLQICGNNMLISPYPSSNLQIPEENDEFISLLHQTMNNCDGSPGLVFQTLLENIDVSTRVDKLRDCLVTAIQVRCQMQPDLCQLCVSSKFRVKNDDIRCSHSKVAVLYSGGLDSAVIAALVDLCVPEGESIDLINVAFQPKQQKDEEVPRKERRRREQAELQKQVEVEQTALVTNSEFDVPDRLTGKKSYMELTAIKPDRPWNFVEVNVSKEELCEARHETIADLIHPRCSVLDDSLGCAVWFAARGAGTLHRSDGTSQPFYVSPARVLLLGMGADELLGGYARCRKLLSRTQDWSQVAASLNHDLTALPTRNLGRDDRVTCDSGRQARFPYLSEGVVRLLAGLPAHLRTAPLQGLPAGVGEKLLLRLLSVRLGLHSAAQAPKRALQFGSKVAGLEARNERGDDICPRLLLST